MTSSERTIIIDDDELPPSWRPTDSQAQITSPCISLQIPIPPSDATSGSTKPSSKRRRVSRTLDTLDTCLRKLRNTVDQKDQEIEMLGQKLEDRDQEVEKLQKQVQELLLQEEELSQRRILECKICLEQSDGWKLRLCGHML
ncbi:hypothetical protein N7537_011422, partial [Penicillium hordei]